MNMNVKFHVNIENLKYIGSSTVYTVAHVYYLYSTANEATTLYYDVRSQRETCFVPRCYVFVKYNTFTQNIFVFKNNVQ